jgi:hypothetical protein
MDLQFFVDLSVFLKNAIKNVNNDINIHVKKIELIDVIYYITYMCLNNYSYSITNMHLQINNILNVTVSALAQKRDSIKSKYIKLINDNLLNDIYHDKEERIIACDGTCISLSIVLKKYGFRSNQNETYCIALLSSLFDVNREIVINYKLCIHHNERKGLLEQLNYLHKGDILLLDRGYYDEKLLYILNKMEIYVIFRLPKNLLIVKKLLDKNQDEMITTIKINDEYIKFRIIKYIIDGYNYYLGTNLLSHRKEYFKKLYWNRWCIEIHFRESKYVLSLSNLKELSLRKTLQNIYSHQLVFIITGYIKDHIKLYIPLDHKVNSKVLIHTIINYLLYHLFYSKFTKNIYDNLSLIFDSLIKTNTKIRKNRSFPRIRIKSVSKFHYCIDI